ncbi:unnamed protein product [Didymodactylos carnosus]|uniref:Uncharacterized protein n=1 Tax=Didymodactylos carnosus TaxID=1234261 RepID=A0A816BTI1_9BILA|nr:unnamed protein product [Didymodactylos carnosus]CAF4500353.1 unnamed protein product [Didymodactylos carnosus]
MADVKNFICLCPFRNQISVKGLENLKCCHADKPVKLYWHLYDTKVHGQQLSSKAATIIIEKMMKNEYDELENSCLSIDQLFRTFKNRNVDSGPAVKSEPQMIIVEDTRSKENFVNTITTSSNLKRSLSTSTLNENENGQNNKLLKTMIEATVQEQLKKLFASVVGVQGTTASNIAVELQESSADILTGLNNSILPTLPTMPVLQIPLTPVLQTPLMPINNNNNKVKFDVNLDDLWVDEELDDAKEDNDYDIPARYQKKTRRTVSS